MRGCLFVVGLGLAVIVAAAWFAGPPLASGIVAAGLNLTGFHAAETTVDVSSDPPLELLVGRADTVRLRARSAEVDGLSAARLDLVLTGVDLVGRRAERVAGRLTDVLAGDEAIAIEEVAIDGPGSAATAVVTIAGRSVESVAARAIEAAVGVPAGPVRLVAPDRLSFVVAGQSAEARLALNAAGSLAASSGVSGMGNVVLVPAAALHPLRVTDLEVSSDGALVLTGRLDVDAILR